jgi:hypothetical protein
MFYSCEFYSFKSAKFGYITVLSFLRPKGVAMLFLGYLAPVGMSSSVYFCKSEACLGVVTFEPLDVLGTLAAVISFSSM